MSKRKPGVSKSESKTAPKSKLKLAEKPQPVEQPQPVAEHSVENVVEDTPATEPSPSEHVDPKPTEATPITPLETATEAQRAQESPMYTLVKSSKPRKGTQVVYTIAGLRGSVRFAGSLFGSNAPESLEISEDGFAAPKAAKVKGPKLSAEERAAQLKESRAKYAALSPAEKKEVAIKNAKAAQERAAKRLAKLSA